MGGGGSGSVVPSFVSTPLEGVRAAVATGSSEVTYDEGFEDLERAAAVAREAIQWMIDLKETCGGHGRDACLREEVRVLGCEIHATCVGSTGLPSMDSRNLGSTR